MVGINYIMQIVIIEQIFQSILMALKNINRSVYNLLLYYTPNYIVLKYTKISEVNLPAFCHRVSWSSADFTLFCSFHKYGHSLALYIHVYVCTGFIFIILFLRVKQLIIKDFLLDSLMDSPFLIRCSSH